MPDARLDLDFSMIVPGSVVTHDDEENSHFAIVLDILPDNYANILMFSSKELGYKVRPVTREELALSGYINSKKTFLSLKRRPLWELRPRGLEFPIHRIEKLKREFMSQPLIEEQLLDITDHGVECLDQ
jgi:hypothetical protein